MATTQPIVGANGNIWFADVSTAKPAIGDDVPDTWTVLGLISDDGVTFGNSRDTSDIMVWQSFYAARRLTTSVENTLAFAMSEWNRSTVEFAFAGGTWSGTEATGYTYVPPNPGEESERAVLLRWQDGDFTAQLYFSRSIISDNDDISLKRDEAALLGVTVTVLGQPDTPAWQLDSADARFAASTGPVVTLDTPAVDGLDVVVIANVTGATTATASIDWGDSSTDTPDVSGGTVSGSHTYAADGTYTVAVTVTDTTTSQSGTDSASVTVAST